MMTTIEMLQAFGLVAVTLFARAALIIGVVAALSVPFMAYAYAARAVEGLRLRHALNHAHHHA